MHHVDHGLESVWGMGDEEPMVEIMNENKLASKAHAERPRRIEHGEQSSYAEKAGVRVLDWDLSLLLRVLWSWTADPVLVITN